MRKHRLWPIIFLLALGCACFGCGQEPEPEPEPEPTPIILPPEPDPEPEPEPEPIYHPLSGREVEQEVSGRVLAVSVDNNPDARPASGVEQADIVYEIPAEGGIPRLIMIFYGTPCEKIGPVRSARPYLVDVARGWDGLFVHCGWSEAAKYYLYSGVVDYINEFSHGGYFWRDKNRYAPHNLYTSTENLTTWLEERDKETEQAVEWMEFCQPGQLMKNSAGQADRVHIAYPHADNTYIYDKDKNSYARYLEKDAYCDAETGHHIYAANIIVQKVRSIVLDNEGRLSIDMCAGGEAILFSGGQVFPGTWSRDNLDSKTVFQDQFGREFQLQHGQTWVQVCDGNVKISWEDSTAPAEEPAPED